MTRFIATFGYVGLIPVAPGTFGSLAVLPFWYLLESFGGWLLVFLMVLLVFAIGTWATSLETAGSADHDPSVIVVDEVAGQLLALLPVSFGLFAFSSLSPTFAVFIAFGLFRLFDILKPWPVSWADNMKTPLGVMLDDILAGFMAALVLTGLSFI